MTQADVKFRVGDHIAWKLHTCGAWRELPSGGVFPCARDAAAIVYSAFDPVAKHLYFMCPKCASLALEKSHAVLLACKEDTAGL